MFSYDDRNRGPHRTLPEDPKVPPRRRESKDKEGYSSHLDVIERALVIHLLLHELEWLSNQFLNS